MNRHLETHLDAPLKELERFVQLERALLARPDGPDRLREARLQEAEGTPHRRLGIVLRRLLLLGTELRAELPDPAGFLEIAAAATVEVALLVTAGGSLARPAPGDALDHLTALQRDRLLLHHPAGALWQELPPEVHLQRAFWQLAGLGLEVMTGGFRDGQLEEHGADLANYLLFATVTAGAWELAADESLLDGGASGGSPAAQVATGSPARRPECPAPAIPGAGTPASPAPESPGAGTQKGDCR